MKNILNDLSEQEKNSIREQYTGGMKVMTDKFNKLLESKLGDVKPILSEQLKFTGPVPVDTKPTGPVPFATKQPKPTGPALITKPKHPVNADKIQLIQIKVGDKLVDLDMMKKTSQGATFYGLVRGVTNQYHQLLFNCGNSKVTMGIMNTAGTGQQLMISPEAMALLNKASGCDSYVKNQDTSSNDVKPLVSEQVAQGGKTFTFPFDVVVSENKILFPKKIKIPKGTIAKQIGNDKVFIGIKPSPLIYVPSQNYSVADAYALEFKDSGQNSYVLQWADSFFGKVFNPQYKKLGEQFWETFQYTGPMEK